MTDDRPDAGDTDRSVEDAFALVGNEIRADILRVLGEAPHEGVAFSELRDRVDGSVDSGRFNYHLQKLVGRFVDDTDDGYVLRTSGLALYRAVQSGAFDREVSLDPFAAGFDCYFCGTAVEAAYEAGSFRLRCPGCDHLYSRTMLPPSATDDGEAALLERVDQFNRRRFGLAASGVCPVCVDGLDLSFVDAAAAWSEGTDRLSAFVHRACDNCGREQHMTVGLALLDHPAVVSFFADHGVDIRSVPHWELEFAVTDNHTTVRSRDPWEVALEVPCEGDRLRVVVDEELTVLETERT